MRARAGVGLVTSEAMGVCFSFVFDLDQFWICREDTTSKRALAASWVTNFFGEFARFAVPLGTIMTVG